MLKAYKYRIYPNQEQKELLEKTFGCCRFVYNFCRAEQKKEEDRWITVKEMQQQGYPLQDYKSKFFHKFDHVNAIKELKQHYAFLKEVDSIALQSSVEHLATAYEKYYKKQGKKPRFKSKKRNDVTSYTTKCVNQNIEVMGNAIKLPKLKKVKAKIHRSFCGKIKQAMVSKTATNQYYVSLVVETNDILPLEKTNQNVGIDLGLVDFVVLSTGEKIPNQGFFEKQLKKIEQVQKELSRKTIGSSNFTKVKRKIAKIHEKIAHQRKDYIHKITDYLVKAYDTICMEDLAVSEMKETDSAKRNLRVSDVGWYELKRELEYKCKWYGKRLSVIDRYYPSSQICARCGHREGKKEERIRSWICPRCQTKLDRDINASRNILKEGLRILKI